MAKKLGYNEDAQVMAVRSVLPRDVNGICMTHKNLKDLKTFLIELFSNSKMREAVPGTASATGDPSVFSSGQHVENSLAFHVLAIWYILAKGKCHVIPVIKDMFHDLELED